MAHPISREAAVRRGRALRTIMRLGFVVSKIGPKEKSGREERRIPTEYGNVRVLLYGFENTEPEPVYFDLHGGGFVLGSADMDEEMNLAVRRGVRCKIVSIDYAKAPDYPYPTALNQVLAVVDCFRKDAAQWGIDPARMAIGGHSAGGNLSAAACLKAKQAGQNLFRCQVLDYPPLDLTIDPYMKPKPKSAIPPGMASIFDACYADQAQRADIFVSPVKARQEDVRGLPPALFILAGRDSLHDEGLAYKLMLEEAGVSVEYYDYPNAGHGFTYKASADSRDALQRMTDFLNRYL